MLSVMMEDEKIEWKMAWNGGFTGMYICRFMGLSN